MTLTADSVEYHASTADGDQRSHERPDGPPPHPRSSPSSAPTDGPAEPGFRPRLRAEWIKLRTVRSTWWTLAATFVLGAGLTILMCWANADWLASADADESPGSFITWGMMIAQITAVVLGALVVTTEYGTGMIRTHLRRRTRRAAGCSPPRRSLVTAVLFVVGTVTALVGYFGGNYFLDREGIGMALEGDVLRAMYGSGLYLAGIGLFTVAVGFLLRHTAGTISIVLALMLILGNMVDAGPRHRSATGWRS